jgi:hypothetical protein
VIRTTGNYAPLICQWVGGASFSPLIDLAPASRLGLPAASGFARAPSPSLHISWLWFRAGLHHMCAFQLRVRVRLIHQKTDLQVMGTGGGDRTRVHPLCVYTHWWRFHADFAGTLPGGHSQPLTGPGAATGPWYPCPVFNSAFPLSHTASQIMPGSSPAGLPPDRPPLRQPLATGHEHDGHS